MALQQLFTDIADAIREKDGTTDDIVASTFPERIRSIPSGGSSPATPLDPVEVYNATRPSDWLPMPAPQDNEMYLLFHIPDGVSSLLAFTVTCTGSYTVALGTVANGQFVQQSTVSVASGAKYEVELFSDDWGGLTSDGFRQCMVKVSGTGIKTWSPSTHSKKTSPANFFRWNIVEISCRLPQGTAVSCGNLNASLALMRLRYFSWQGENMLTTTYGMFQGCRSLIAVLSLNTENVTMMSSMFGYCPSLAAIPLMDTAKVTNMSSMFDSCQHLAAIPLMDTKNVINMANMFTGCYSLATIPPLDTAKTGYTGTMFSNCFSLSAVPKLNTAGMINMTNIFSDCTALGKLSLDPAVTGWAGIDFSLSGCSLGHAALVDLLNSLPTITASHTLTLTGNPGVPELTAAEQSIATAKGWTLTL